MDDDKTLKVSFPVGDTGTVTVSQPTDGQRMALALSQNPTDRASMIRLVRRVARVMENLMGSEQWEEVVEYGLINGTLDPNDLMTLVSDVLTFDWTLGAKQEVPSPAPSEPAQPPVPDRTPRVVSGG